MVGIQDWFKQQRLKNRLVFDLFVESGIIQWRFNEYWVNPGRWLVDGFGRSRKWRKSSDPTSLKMCVLFLFFSEYERLAMNIQYVSCPPSALVTELRSLSLHRPEDPQSLCVHPQLKAGHRGGSRAGKPGMSMVMSRLPTSYANLKAASIHGRLIPII